MSPFRRKCYMRDFANRRLFLRPPTLWERVCAFFRGLA